MRRKEKREEDQIELKQSKGITLIALVVTIIILLILAGVTIYFVVNSGLIGKTEEAKTKSNQGTENDLDTMNLAEEEIAKYINGNNSTIEGLPEGLKGKIPEGFHYVEGSIEEGAVIEDAEGNQFVWIPVDGVKVKYERQDFGKQYGNYSEYSEVIDTEAQNSVNTNGGFYIARFEAGNSSNTVRTSASDLITDKVVSKKNNTVYNYVTRDQAKTLAESMYPGKSKLVSSYAWDAIMNFVADDNHSIIDSSNWGNYYDSSVPANIEGYGVLQNTGYSEYWKAKNIYDLAGNSYEWTTEGYSDAGYPCVRRGGSYYFGGTPVSYRSSDTTSNSISSVSFRVVLYL